MANLTQAQRDKLPESDFGDPTRRLYPVLDQDDVDSAAKLIGKAHDKAAVKKRVIAIAKRKGLKVPEAWQADMSAFTAQECAVAQFAVDASGRYEQDGFAVYPQALVFEAGEYKDKNFTLTPEEMDVAVSTFTPCMGDIEHTGFLDGRALEVRSIRLDEGNSSILRGEVAVPLWLDTHLEPAERRLSAVWDRTDKQMVSCTLTMNPRVEKAALVAAYSQALFTGAAFARPRHDTRVGQSQLQQLHDETVRMGAVCKAPGGKAAMASAHESKAIQGVHDSTVEHGATCDDGSSRGGYMGYFSRGKENAVSFWSDLFKGAQEAGLVSPDATPAEQFTAAQGTAPAAATTPAPAAQAMPAVVEMSASDRAEIDELKRELAAERARRILDQAAHFASAEITAKRALPAERAQIEAAFAQALRDDAQSGPVTFSKEDGTEGKVSRVEQLQAMFAARPAHTLDQEQVLANGVAAAFNAQETPTGGDDDKPMSLERRKALLEATPEGRALWQKQYAAAYQAQRAGVTGTAVKAS